MKRSLYAPLMLSNLTEQNRGEYLQQLRETGAARLFIAIDRSWFFTIHTPVWQEKLVELRAHMDYFEENGLEVGLWMQAFGFGDPLSDAGKAFTQGWTKILSVEGREAGDAFCPEDPGYMEAYCRWVESLAALHPAFLMLDDDLCLSARPGLSCFCPRHRAKLAKKLGRSLTLPGWEKELFTGKGSPARKIWLETMGDTLRDFCRKTEETVHRVSPETRLGFCAGFTSWDLEGADAAELSYILAGKNKPFLRFTGAPYWVAPHWNRFPGQRLHAVIEFTRAQEAWCRKSGVECFSEADSYPRPRYHIPASLLECFDTAMAASDSTPVLKYIFDYHSPVGYEPGYARAHRRNLPLYEFLEQHFTGKTAAGVQVYERMQKFADMELPEDFDPRYAINTALPCAASMLAQLCIPVTYEENPACAIAFGNNATELRTLPQKLILDLPAALLLQEKGYDLGIRSADVTENGYSPFKEYFGEAGVLLTHAAGRYYRCSLAPNVQVHSEFASENDRFPASFSVKTGDTECLIFAFDAYSLRQDASVFCSYARQAQLLALYSDFPVLRGQPFVYSLYKKGNGGTALFFANIFEDELWDVTLELDHPYTHMESCGAPVQLNGDRLHIEHLPAYGMLALHLS